jgi:hypothetical protein
MMFYKNDKRYYDFEKLFGNNFFENILELYFGA